MLLLDWAKSCGFLNSPSQELSEYIVFVSGILISASLELRDQCVSSISKYYLCTMQHHALATAEIWIIINIGAKPTYMRICYISFVHVPYSLRLFLNITRYIQSDSITIDTSFHLAQELGRMVGNIIAYILIFYHVSCFFP